ncbi:MAG: hypothetical protein JST93_22025 [Acidobacteria bacterium]|nr:hypothetical protein [Acidobacteriota bacterium]
MLPLLALLLTTPSQACLCNPGPRTPCEKNMSAEIAFTGQVKEIHRYTIGEFEFLRVRIEIDEAFKGITGKEAVIHTSTSSCGVPFELNRRYLIDAWISDKGQLTTGACSRTQFLESASEDFENLRNLNRTDGPVKVFGFATANPFGLVIPYRAAAPAPNLTITLRSGERQWQTTTDTNGEYAFTGIPPGEFQLTINLADLPEKQRTHSFTLKSGECRGAYFITVPAANIFGHLHASP